VADTARALGTFQGDAADGVWCSAFQEAGTVEMGTIDLLATVFPCVATLQDEHAKLKITLADYDDLHRAYEVLRDEQANKELEMQRLKVLLEAERSNKPHEPRTIRPRTAAEMRRLMEHQNAEEMEQEAV
jgi:hypothetical protein